ncbi:MAG: glycosyltransferase family 4 protein [Planctomycetota bacterium]
MVGYLARVCHDKGLHVLVDACERIAADHEFELHAAGYLGAADKPYLDELHARVARGPLAGRFRYRGEIDLEQKIDFLHSLAVFATPTVYRESKGLPAIEALAAGVPVVLPEHGSFPELVAESGGGLLHRPEDAGHLAERLAELLTDRERAATLGERGRRHVHEHRHAGRMAEQTLALYRSLTAPSAPGSAGG